MHCEFWNDKHVNTSPVSNVVILTDCKHFRIICFCQWCSFCQFQTEHAHSKHAVDYFVSVIQLCEQNCDWSQHASHSRIVRIHSATKMIRTGLKGRIVVCGDDLCSFWFISLIRLFHRPNDVITFHFDSVFIDSNDTSQHMYCCTHTHTLSLKLANSLSCCVSWLKSLFSLILCRIFCQRKWMFHFY